MVQAESYSRVIGGPGPRDCRIFARTVPVRYAWNEGLRPESKVPRGPPGSCKNMRNKHNSKYVKLIRSKVKRKKMTSTKATGRKVEGVDFEYKIWNMVSSFRVSELQVLLGFAGRNKSGRKHELLVRALHLLKSGCSPAVQIKIKELYRRRFPRTIESLADLSAIKSSVFSLDNNLSADSELASGIAQSSASTSATPQPSSPLVSPVLLHETKPNIEMQEASSSIHPVHPDVQLKSIPFYDVLDVLIKPTSLGEF
uniref:E3 SUMO-protein ligase PIAS2-like n=1 Tax=Pristiophorus japonicus TaxID=55135 RepID=UPI00398F7FA2